MPEPTRNELRCFCRREPLLAVYGVDKRGKLYIHVKIWKNRRVYGEMLVTEGRVHLRCRECMRWHQVHINPGKQTAKLMQSFPSDTMVEDEAADHV